MSNAHLPIPRPAPLPGGVPDRGGVDAEQLRQTADRAREYAAAQIADSASMVVLSTERRAALVAREQEIVAARTVLARAQTLRAEGNMKLALGAAGGVIATMILAPAVLRLVRGDK